VSSVLTRRQFVSRSAVGLAAMASLGLSIDGFVSEPPHPVIEKIDVHLARLPEAFEGFRIVQMSDIHFGPYMDQVRLERGVRLAQEFQPDLIALTGDFVSHPFGKHNGPAGAKNAEPCADVLARWKGVPMIAVLGNHDHWNNGNMVAGALAERGIRVLRNQAQALERGGERIWVAGTDDALEGQADLPASLAAIPRDDATVLLAHEPDFADYAARFPVDLQLSGHSHGGQVRIPGIGPIVLPAMARKYHTGLNRVGNLQVYTSRGLGVINPPVRLNCPPEVSFITLLKGKGKASAGPL
jgi:predicted MPP superfamily phosphohydrolase